jgi:hypothetical protein
MEGQSEHVAGGTEDSRKEMCFFGLSASETFHRAMDRHLGCCVAYHQELLE